MARTSLLVLLAAAAPAAAQAPRIGQAELVQRLAHAVDSLAGSDQFSGVVLLARDGKPVWSVARGMADRQGGRPNTLETAFNLGSINKLFTAIAIRQLIAAGKLSLDSTIATYWPDYPNAEFARHATISQLLTHQSGIGGDIFGVPASGTRLTIRHNRDFFPLFAGAAPLFAPGARQEYANAGYVVLGMLIERVSGVDYYQYIQDHIYRPAGMTRTGHFHRDSLPPNTALGYTRGDNGDGPLRPNTEELPGRGSAAGGGYSTAGDLLLLIQALRADRIPGGRGPGIGVAGGTGGVNAVVEGDLVGGYDLIVLTNFDPPAAQRVARLVRAWLGAED